MDVVKLLNKAIKKRGVTFLRATCPICVEGVGVGRRLGSKTDQALPGGSSAWLEASHKVS